jgi:hypothetical protein
MPYDPIRADLDEYRDQAMELLKACEAHDPETLKRVRYDLNDGPSIRDVKLTLSREHGFDNWQEFKYALKLAPQFREALDPGDPERVRAILDEVPQLANCVPWPKHRPDAQAIKIVSDACVWHRPLKHEIAQALIDAGATCDITIAARAGLIDHVREQLGNDPTLIDCCDRRGRTALYRAGCVYGSFKEGEAVVDLLLERFAQPDIFVAATFAMAERVGELLDKNDDLATCTDPDGMTALHWAVRPRRANGHDQPTRVTRLLLEAGADVHAINPAEQEMLPLHHAGEWGAAHPQQIDLLLSHGADVNAKSGIGWTPLDYAIDRSRAAIAEYLKAKGAKESGARS